MNVLTGNALAQATQGPTAAQIKASTAAAQQFAATLRAAGLTAAEIADARRVLENQQVRGLETNGAFAFTVGLDELYGLGATHYQGLSARLAAVTPQRTQAAAEALFDPAYALVVDVGPGPDASHD